jgi:hypothetical protein
VDLSTGPLASFDKPEGCLERQVNRFAALWEVAVLRTSPEVAELAGRPETKPPHDPGRIRPRRPPTRAGWPGVMAIQVEFSPRVEWTRVDKPAVEAPGRCPQLVGAVESEALCRRRRQGVLHVVGRRGHVALDLL